MMIHPRRRKRKRRRRKKIVQQRGDVSWKMAQLLIQSLSLIRPLILLQEVEGGVEGGPEEAEPEVQMLGEAEVGEGEGGKAHVVVLVQEVVEVHIGHEDLAHEVVEVASPNLLQDLQITQWRRSKKTRPRG